MDFQVKVHGLRIELGEIETAMVKHPAVAEACVVARGQRGDLSLAGFVRIDEGQDYDEQSLKDWMSEFLPTHMVPSTITQLEVFPINPNGKVDRNVLSAMKPTMSASTGAAPTDELEERIAAVFQEILNVERIGIDDDFFDSGGDSFAAVRAMLALDSPVLVVELFKNPTVRSLAKRIRTAQTDKPDVLNELKAAGPQTEATLVCVPYGGGSSVGYQPLSQQLSDRFALWAVNLPGHEPGRDEEYLSFDEAARRCVADVIKRITGPVIVYGHCTGTVLAIDLARRLEEAGVELRAVYLGASLPVQNPVESLASEKVTSDEQWAAYLTSIGGFDGALDWSTVEHMMTAGRADHVGAMNFLVDSYETPQEKVKTKVHLVFGDEDPATDNFENLYTNWYHFAENMDLTVINGGNHYFVRNHATELAALIDQQVA